ncbi:Nicotinamidase-related amidase [Nakamurella panacisegetis]|uniref:Nicotinamidase-related amidase n=1 Tax=Nakamurella panacisegetis TaxID=1090615 RepID=A0A1H0L983_9ACTN|nr:cysteine hydrolase [Nakamurella panacisegetis]SDO64758.1 Nicotinamidase-related amidase [Nakamurella panacisegetis]
MSIDRRLRPDRHPVLLVSECQNGLINTTYATTMAPLAVNAEQRSIVPKIAALAETFRAAGLPVAFATIVPAPDWAGFGTASPLGTHTRRRDQFKDGTPLPELHPGLGVHPEDLIFPRRTGMTSFYRSGLGAALRERGIDTVVLAGISSNIAIPGTTVEAVNRDLSVVIAEDCTAGTSQEIHDFTFSSILPALATISNSIDIAAVIAAR